MLSANIVFALRRPTIFLLNFEKCCRWPWAARRDYFDLKENHDDLHRYRGRNDCEAHEGVGE